MFWRERNEPIQNNRNRESMSSIRVNDCWNKIGVWGNRECVELKSATHCRNCNVYSSAARELLGAELPADYLERWTTYFAAASTEQSRPMEAALIFRTGAEWLALSPTHLQEIAEAGPIHSVPGRGNALLGLSNIGGQLLVCIALSRLLGLKNSGLPNGTSKRSIYRRMIVAGRQDSRFVFPVDEVHGIHRFDPSVLTPVPSTVPKSQRTYLRGILPWENVSVSYLDDKSLFEVLDRSLT
jgi:chemotaxis-related protein WspD